MPSIDELQDRRRIAILAMMNDGFDNVFVPAAPTKQMSLFSRSLDASHTFRRVPVVPVKGTKPSQCFNNCITYSKQFGGKIVYGWAWHQWRNLFVVAEFHAVWQSPRREYLDITPSPHQFTMFSIDPNREANNVNSDDPIEGAAQAIESRRFALSDSDEAKRYLAVDLANVEVNRRQFSGDRTLMLEEIVCAIEANVEARRMLMQSSSISG